MWLPIYEVIAAFSSAVSYITLDGITYNSIETIRIRPRVGSDYFNVLVLLD